MATNTVGSALSNGKLRAQVKALSQDRLRAGMADMGAMRDGCTLQTWSAESAIRMAGMGSGFTLRGRHSSGVSASSLRSCSSGFTGNQRGR